MCETRTCGFCIANHARVKLTDGTFAHGFENPDHPKGPIAWCEPCEDSARYEACKHENFAASVIVNRLEDSGAFVCDIRVKCSDCKTEFEFPDPPFGLSSHEVCVSMDGKELRVPCKPSGQKAFPVFAGFSVKRTA